MSNSSPLRPVGGPTAWLFGRAQFYAVAVAGLLLAGTASAVAVEASDWIRGEHSSVRLISAADGIGPEGTIDIGIQVRLPRGWKTYWRVPGQTGVPTRFDWAGSTNLASARVGWPTPKRFTDYEMESFGYTGEIVFPVHITAAAPGEAVSLALKLSFGVCKEICIPMEAELALALPPVEQPDETRHTKMITGFGAKIPGANGEQGLRISSLILKSNPQLERLQVEATSETPFEWPDVALELPQAYRVGVPGVKLSLDRRYVRLSMPLWSNDGAHPLAGEDIVVTLWDRDGRAVTHAFTVSAPEPVPEADISQD